MAKAKLAKKARFQSGPLRAGTAGLSKPHKYLKFFWVLLVFRPFPGAVFELRFGLEKCEIYYSKSRS